MDFWGIVAIVAVAWIGLSLPLGLLVGRVIRVSDVKEAEIVQLRSARLEPVAHELVSAA